MAPDAADAAHPAFSNLFVQTEINPKQRSIICTRAPARMTSSHHLCFILCG